MKIGLIINFEKEIAVSKAKETIDILSKKCDLICDESTYSRLNFSGVSSCANLFDECDICIIIGGDGTILHNAKKAAQYGKAVLGINAGRIGYLAGLGVNELDRLTELLNKNYKTEERIMLDVEHISGNNYEKYTAFNDAVISKGSLSRMIDIELLVGGHNLNYRADGLIIATPTGSTAYSMSAGGPVLDPLVENMVITPICPYSHFTRSIVLPSFEPVSTKVDASENKEAYLTVDGEVAVRILNGDIVNVNQSDTKVKLINLRRDNKYNFLERITGGCYK